MTVAPKVDTSGRCSGRWGRGHPTTMRPPRKLPTGPLHPHYPSVYIVATGSLVTYVRDRADGTRGIKQVTLKRAMTIPEDKLFHVTRDVLGFRLGGERTLYVDRADTAVDLGVKFGGGPAFH